jgi:hypothetical protein
VPACLLRQGQGKAIVIYSRCEDEALCRAELLAMLNSVAARRERAVTHERDQNAKIRPLMRQSPSAGWADARRRDAGDVRTSSRSGNAADARPPPRPFGLRPPGPPAALLAPYIPRRVGSSLVSCRRAWGPQQSGPVIL